MSGNVFDAAVLLISDGVVAVGRVLGGFRRRSGWERQAGAVDALNALEDNQDGLEPGQLARPSLDSLLDAYWKAKSPEVESQALGDLAKYFPDGKWTQGVRADAVRAPEPVSHGFSGQCPNVGRACNCTGACLPKPHSNASNTASGLMGVVRSAAVSPPAADNTPECECFWTDPSTWTTHYGATEPGSQMEWNPECPVHLPDPPVDDTTEVDHLEAAWHYHRPQANYNGNLVWGCEGCNWHGPTIQAHSRHRFHVLADMKAATTRVQEQLGGTG